MATPSDESVRDLAETYMKGVTLAVLAQNLGVSIPTVTKWVKKGGATIRPRGQRKKGTVTASVPNTPEMNKALDAVEEAARGGYYEPGTEDVPVTRQIFNAEV